MRVRLRFAKTGKVRFSSAIDLGRVWERALRKGGVPVAYSEGFSPHPKVSFPDALPVGYESLAEYCEITLAAPIPLAVLQERLNRAFPPGLEVLLAVEVQEGQPRLSKWLQASCWDVSYPAEHGLAAAVTAVATASSLPVERTRKGETQHIDLRPALRSLSRAGTTVRAVLAHAEHIDTGPAVAVRPSEVHAALRLRAPGLHDPVQIIRVAQGTPTDGGLTEALSGEFVPPLATTVSRPERRGALDAPGSGPLTEGDPHDRPPVPADRR